MLVVETIAKIRRAFFHDKKAIKAISRELKVSRKVIRRVIRSSETEFHYGRSVQPLPKIGPWRADLEKLLIANEGKPKREQLTMMRIFEEVHALGYDGSYDAVRRYAKAFAKERGAAQAEAYIPLSFSAGEAYQFDWSHEVVVINGVTWTVKVAHFKLCHSRMPFVRAYPRESQEMVFDAHERAFGFYKGACSRGIYDNMKTAVDAVYIGKDRQFNRRFLQMCGHYLVEPTACTPAAGWEKGQVENQVGLVRERFFTPRLKVKSFEELNGLLLDKCVAYAKAHKHPEFKDKTIWQVFEDERPKLVPVSSRFDGFHMAQASVSKTCLVRFDNNRYSVPSRAVGRPVEVQAYADRIVIRQHGVVIAEHARRFGRGQTTYDPWHYVPILSKKPGALRNGAPFKDWVLPSALEKVRRKLRGSDDGDKQMVEILSAVLTDGLAAVDGACAEALVEGCHSASVILNILARTKDPGPAITIMTPEALQLRQIPLADCNRYDSLRRIGHGTQ
jgi:transposase